MFFRRWRHAPALDLQQLCNLVVQRLIAAGNTTWHENAFLPEHYADPAKSAEALKILCARHLLAEAGDYEGASRVFESLNAIGVPEGEPFRFMRLMCAHLSASIGNTRLATIRNDKSIIGLVVWGDAYIAQLGHCSIPSLLA